MKWNGLFLFAVLLLFSFSGLLYSEVILTDEEYETILTALEESVQDLEQSGTLISELKQDLKNSEKLINLLKEEQTISANIISLLKLESSLQLKSLKERRTGQMIQDLKMFGLGVLSGGLVGTGAGIRIGLSF